MKAKKLLLVTSTSFALFATIGCNGGQNKTTHPSVLFYGVDSLNYDAQAAKEAQYGKDLVIEFTPNNQFAHLDYVVDDVTKVAEPYVGYGNALNPVGYRLQKNKAYTYKQISTDKYQLTIKGDYFKDNIIVSFDLGSDYKNEQYGVTPVKQSTLDEVAKWPDDGKIHEHKGYYYDSEKEVTFKDPISNYIFSDIVSGETTGCSDSYGAAIVHSNPEGKEKDFFAEYYDTIYSRDYDSVELYNSPKQTANPTYYYSPNDLGALNRDYYSIVYEKLNYIPSVLLDSSKLKFTITATLLKRDGTEDGSKTLIAIDDKNADGDYFVEEKGNKIYINFPWTTKGTTQDAHGGLFYNDVKKDESHPYGYAIKYKDIHISCDTSEVFKIKNGLNLYGFGGEGDYGVGDVKFDVSTSRDYWNSYRLCYGENPAGRPVVFDSKLTKNEYPEGTFDPKNSFPSASVTLTDKAGSTEIKFSKSDENFKEFEVILNQYVDEGSTYQCGVKVCYVKKSMWQFNCVCLFKKVIDKDGKSTTQYGCDDDVYYTIIPCNANALLASDNTGEFCSNVVVKMTKPTFDK